MGQLHNKKTLLESRRQLRNNPTGAEFVLWKRLQNSQLQGRKFRRQHSIGNYIPDFYCPEEKLVIELDGVHHYTNEGKGNDAERDKILAELDIKVLRYENRLIFEEMENVLRDIASHFTKNQLIPPRPHSYRDRPSLVRRDKYKNHLAGCLPRLNKEGSHQRSWGGGGGIPAVNYYISQQ